MEVVVRTGVKTGAKHQSNHHHQHPTFYRQDFLPVATNFVSHPKLAIAVFILVLINEHQTVIIHPILFQDSSEYQFHALH